MRAIITGARGTLAKILSKHLQEQGIEVIAWDRQAVPIDQYQAMEDFVRSVQPDMLSTLRPVQNQQAAQTRDGL